MGTEDTKVDGRMLEQLPPVKHVWQAPSGSRPGMFHYVFLYDTGVVDCTCEGWRMSKKCWHTTMIREEHGLDDEFEVSLD